MNVTLRQVLSDPITFELRIGRMYQGFRVFPIEEGFGIAIGSSGERAEWDAVVATMEEAKAWMLDYPNK